MKTPGTSRGMVKRILQDGALGFLRKIHALDEGSDWTNFQVCRSDASLCQTLKVKEKTARFSLL